MLLTLNRTPQKPCKQRSIQCHLMNRKSWTNSSMKIYAKDTSDLLNPPLHPQSSLLKRKMANYNLYRTTTDSMNTPLKTDTHSLLSLTSLVGFVMQKSLPSLMSDGDTTMFESRRGMNGKEHLQLIEDFLNHWLCSLA